MPISSYNDVNQSHLHYGIYGKGHHYNPTRYHIGMHPDLISIRHRHHNGPIHGGNSDPAKWDYFTTPNKYIQYGGFRRTRRRLPRKR